MTRLFALALLLPLATPPAWAQRATAPEIEGAFVEALAQQRRGDHEEALAAFEQLLIAAPEAAAVFDAIAESHAALGQTEEAVLAAETAVRLAPEEPLALRRLAALRRESGDATGALAAYEALRRQRPRDAEALAALSDLYADAGRGLDAVDALEALVRVGDTPAARLRLAAYAQASGDTETQIRHLRRANRLAPDEGAIALALADAQEASGDDRGARATLSTFLARQPSDAQAQAALARLSGDAPAAASSLSPDDRLRRARDLYDASDEAPDGLDEAERLLAPLLSASPSPEALALAGRVAFRQRRYADAADRLVLALDADPRDAGAWALALRALARSMNPRAARMADDGLLFLASDPAVASGAAEAFLSLDDPARARDAAPETPDGFALRAIALARLAEPDAAQDAFAEASGADPVLRLAASAAIATARGDDAMARAALDEARALDPANEWLGSGE
ncbi:MAG: tetratricopeptide repeat protein [Bacteroidota bacterium]